MSSCRATNGKPCIWVSDEEYDDAGELVNWDLYCADCYRPRDWSKIELPPDSSPAATPTPTT